MERENVGEKVGEEGERNGERGRARDKVDRTSFSSPRLSSHLISSLLLFLTNPSCRISPRRVPWFSHHVT